MEPLPSLQMLADLAVGPMWIMAGIGFCLLVVEFFNKGNDEDID